MGRGKSKGRASGGRPPGLKGKAIGLYYKQKRLQNESSADETPSFVRPPDLKSKEIPLYYMQNNAEMSVDGGRYPEVRPPGLKGRELGLYYKQKNTDKLTVDQRRSSAMRPPGLKGKELGYYYRDRQREKSGVKAFVRKLKVPEAVVAALKSDIKSIEEIAGKEGIYLEPVKVLKFVKPNTDGADFIPLQASDCEKEYHRITNIFPIDNDVIYVSKDSYQDDDDDDDDVVFVTTAQYDPMSDDDDLIEVTSSDCDSKILLDEELDTPTAKKAKADCTAMDLIFGTDVQPSNSNPKPCFKLEKETVSSTVSESDSDGSMKMKAEIEPVSSCSSTNINDMILGDDIEPSTSYDKPKEGIVSNQLLHSMANKEINSEIEPVAGCSSTNINNMILGDDNNDDIEPSTSDVKPKEGTVSSQLFHSMANKEINSEIEPVAGCASTNINEMILGDDIEPSTSDDKPKEGIVSSQLLHSMANKEINSEIEPVAGCSSTNINNMILGDDNNDDIEPSTSDVKPKEGTVSSQLFHSMANKKINSEIEPVAGCSSTNINDMILGNDSNDHIEPSTSDVKPKEGTVSNQLFHSMANKEINSEIEPVAGCSSTNINNMILGDDNNDDIEPSTSDVKPKEGTVSSQLFHSMANKKINSEIEPVAGCSSTNINDMILGNDSNDHIEPSTSDVKPKEGTVSSQLFHSMANKEINSEIEPVAGCSSTNINNMILGDDNNDDIEPSTSDVKPKEGTVSSQLFHSMANKKINSEIEPVAGCSSTNINDMILGNDSNDHIEPSTSDVKPKEGTVSNQLFHSMPNKEMKAEIEPVAGCSSTNLNDMILVDDIEPTTSDDNPKNGTVSNRKIEPVASCSNTKLNDVILLDDNDEDIILVQSDYDMSETNSRPMNQSESIFGQKDFHTAHKDFKYGYEDIVTGKFEDKLDESLAKGIDINIRNEKNNQLSKDLLDDYTIMLEKPKYKEMKQFREILPAYKMAQELLDVVNNNQVIVISGETGCGKSTQVPQLILDDALKNKRGANVKIFVTEPRRIAASSLAMRIAEERSEPTGKSVGYAVRLERVECRPRGSIMFCTTGVLLVELETNQSLSNFTHIILDEVHERDCQIDISMCMLRQVLKKRKDLKLILMSATIDSESLSAYFDNCPLLHITGLAYPVKDIYLEEILHMTRYKLPPINDKPRGRPEKVWMKHLSERKADAAREMEKEIRFRAEIGPWLESIRKLIDRDVYLTLQDRRIEELDVRLILQLLLCITRSDPGAILVFLPGIADITKLIRLMDDSRMFPSSHFEIHPLHSKLPTLTQHKIFKRPPKDIRKIILATNIAETSITIDDIVFVVDSAKVKFKGLNVKDHVTTLQTEWASQANLRQRRGRAGRCQPGICYHLVTTFRASKLEERPLPELQRDDLLEAVLQIKRLRLGLAAPALAMMPAPPHESTINNAIRHLQQCGAVDQHETLTPLGWHLARLPVHPAAGKLLLFGALFGCLERAACVAAVWGFKDPFNLVIGKEKQVDEAKKHLALGEPSDHIAISEALMQWDNFETHAEKYDFARQFFLSMTNLKLLTSMKQQFGQNLKQMGFLRSGNVKSSWENRNTDNLALFKAIVAAALYPNIGVVRWKKSPKNPFKHPYITVKTTDWTSVQIHPSSVMSNKEHRYPKNKSMPLCARPGANWLVYWLKQRSTSLYLLDVTLVYTLPLLFFGELNVTQGETRDECLIDINTIKVCCDQKTTLLLFRLRSFLDQVLASKIMASGEVKRSSKFEEHVLNAVIKLITAEDAKSENIDGDDISDSEYSNDGKAWY